MRTGDAAVITARYLDGKVAREQEVTLTLAADGMTIHTADGDIMWPRAEIELVDHLDRGTRVRFSHEGEPNARVVVLGRKAVERCHACWPEIFNNRRGGLRRDLKRLVIGVAGLAVAGAIAVAALPIIISVLAAMVPASTEKRIGDEAVAALTSVIPELSKRCVDPDGLAVIERLVENLGEGIELDAPLRVRVVPHGLVNAMAFPGGQVFVFKGLIDEARSGAEIAGVLAHEIGHVHHRHGMKRLIRDGAIDAVTSVFSPGTTSSISGSLASQIASRSYGRDAEREADSFAVERLNSLGYSAEGIVDFFERAQARQAGKQRSPTLVRFLQSHPGPEDRIVAIRSGSTGTGKVLDQKEWQALRRICQLTVTD
ncbi:MAG: M48 family metallopeptidase [Minwuia sp.]|nr:M48 family metallopeptidase [Minwuia sp.]